MPQLPESSPSYRYRSRSFSAFNTFKSLQKSRKNWSNYEQLIMVILSVLYEYSLDYILMVIQVLEEHDLAEGSLRDPCTLDMVTWK